MSRHVHVGDVEAREPLLIGNNLDQDSDEGNVTSHSGFNSYLIHWPDTQGDTKYTSVVSTLFSFKIYLILFVSRAPNAHLFMLSGIHHVSQMPISRFYLEIIKTCMESNQVLKLTCTWNLYFYFTAFQRLIFIPYLFDSCSYFSDVTEHTVKLYNRSTAKDLMSVYLK